MRMQLKSICQWLLLLPLAVKGVDVQAQQSRVKVKKLKYTEEDPGIVVDEESVEAVIELDNTDQINMFYLHDAISGASPAGYSIDPSTDATTSASGGTVKSDQQYRYFEDERNAYTLGYKKALTSNVSAGVTLNYSKENDYESSGYTLNGVFLMNQKNTELTLSYTRNDDTILEAGSLEEEQSKEVSVISSGVSQLLSPRKILGFGGMYGFSNGFHGDPYKQVKVGEQIIDESRPDTRKFTAYYGDFKSQFADHHSVYLKLEQYNDTWGINAGTWEVETTHEFTKEFLMSFYFRMYNQNAADFWGNSFDASYVDQYRSGDPRLAAFSANTYSTTLYYFLTEQLMLEGSVGQYIQYDGGTSLFVSNTGLNPVTRLDGDEDDDEYEGDDHEEGESHHNILTKAVILSIAVEYRF